MRSRLPAILAVCVFVFGLPDCARRPQPPAAPSPRLIQYVHSCLPKDVNLREAKPLHFAADQLRQYLSSYETTSVRALRTAIDAFGSGHPDQETAKSIAPYKSELVHHAFVVMAIVDNPFGGADIEFQDPHTFRSLFRAWVYTHSDGSSVIRSLSRTPCSAAEQRWIAARYAPAMAIGDDTTLIPKSTPTTGSAAGASPTPRAVSGWVPIAPTPADSASAQIARPRRPNPDYGARAPAAPAAGVSEADCEDVSVDGIYDDGAIIELLDGRRFHVSDADQVTSDVWVAPFDGLICGDKLINKDDNESVELTPE